MATIKVACPKCGQKVSGDESFFGTVVECPVCSADIRFPGRHPEADAEKPGEEGLPAPGASRKIEPVPPEPVPAEPGPPADDVAGESTSAALPETEETSRGASGAAEADDDALSDEVPSPLWGALSIVSGALGLVGCPLGAGMVFAPLAIVCGHTALAKARHSPVQPAPGHTLGAIGLIIGYIGLASTIVLLLLALVFLDPIRELLGQMRD